MRYFMIKMFVSIFKLLIYVPPIVFIGCSTTKNVNNLSNFNQVGSITLISNNKRVLINKINYDLDSFTVEKRNGEITRIPVHDVDSIIVNRKLLGTFQGLGIGFLSGVAIGTAIGFVGMSSVSQKECIGCEVVFLGSSILISTATGIIIGPIIGAKRGSKLIYLIK